MTRYIIFTEYDKKPLKKIKHEYEAFNFVEDIRNLQRYGCMTIVKETDTDGVYVWNRENSAWESIEA